MISDVFPYALPLFSINSYNGTSSSGLRMNEVDHWSFVYAVFYVQQRKTCDMMYGDIASQSTNLGISGYGTQFHSVKLYDFISQMVQSL
jgi:hypothetical protein